MMKYLEINDFDGDRQVLWKTCGYLTWRARTDRWRPE
jgi:hypothetical protein